MRTLCKGLAGLFMALLWLAVATSAHAATYTIRTVNAWPQTTFEAKQFKIFMDLAQKEADQKYPGQLKIVSIMIAPPKRLGKRRPRMVITGSRALRRA